MGPTGPVVIKKYGNRRLYDTADSAYITLEQLADKVRRGLDIRVVDAKTNEDLTQATLAQLILESRGAAHLLPVPLLVQLIRMGDDALAEFLGRYMIQALELYLQARQGAQAVAPFNPFANMPFQAANAFARMYQGMWPEGPMPGAPMPSPMGMPMPGPVGPPPAAQAPAATSNDVADLRRELDELKQALRRRK